MKSLKTFLAVIAYIAVFLCTIYLAPQKEFCTNNTQMSLICGAQDYLGEDSGFTIRSDAFFSIHVGEQLVCILQDRDDKALMGAVVFQKGRNSRYRAINADYGNSTLIRSIATRSLLSDPISCNVLYATNLPKDAKYIEILNYSMFNLSGEFREKYVTTVEIKETPFIYVHAKSGFRNFRLLDIQGNVLSNTQTSKENPKNVTMTTLIGDLPPLIAIIALHLIFLVPTLLLKRALNEKDQANN